MLKSWAHQSLGSKVNFQIAKFSRQFLLLLNLTSIMFNLLTSSSLGSSFLFFESYEIPLWHFLHRPILRSSSFYILNSFPSSLPSLFLFFLFHSFIHSKKSHIALYTSTKNVLDSQKEMAIRENRTQQTYSLESFGDIDKKKTHH